VTNVPQLRDIGTMLKLLAQMGIEVQRRRQLGVTPERVSGLSTIRGAVRNGQDHACVDPGARTAGRAMR
jgi:UDP-N-acetylglucosamine enolpyruvyl transferase